ncbi:hypothetical protein Amal_03730 [Acetobacter malorum]|uniref:Uncharacterized protein n=1 Tax=Acetobacter malorum TaxID=178901 RepID=A0A177G5P0_9PROT|nr:hypothetical protein Amal_03730 [Acetobacter malorum]
MRESVLQDEGFCLPFFQLEKGFCRQMLPVEWHSGA